MGREFFYLPAADNTGRDADLLMHFNIFAQMNLMIGCLNMQESRPTDRTYLV